MKFLVLLKKQRGNRKLVKSLEKWVQEATEKNDVLVRNARAYLDQIPTDALFSQEPVSFRSCRMKSIKGDGSKSSRSGRTSKTQSSDTGTYNWL